MVGVIKLGRKRAAAPTTVTPVSSAGPYQPVAGYVPSQVANVSGGATGTGTGQLVNVNALTNPRAPASTPLGLGESAVYDLGTRNITLTTGVTTDQTLNLPMLADTIELDFVLTNTYTGYSSGTGDVVNSIDHVQLATAQGLIKIIIPGTFLKINYLRFSPQRNNLPAATFTSSTGTASIPIPGLRLARAYGPWQLTVFYSSIATAGAYTAGVTAVSVSNHILGYYGSAGGKVSRYLNQGLALVNGTNMIQTTSVPQNVPISELFISGLANATDITQLLLQTNGQIIEPNTSGSLLVARAASRFVGTLPSGQVALLPSTQFTLNSSSEFQLVTSQAENGATFLWYWLE
jgi:hypothetical protein